MDETENCCEHGDHKAPLGHRYCSKACADCDGTEQPDDDRCAGICGRSPIIRQRVVWNPTLR